MFQSNPKQGPIFILIDILTSRIMQPWTHDKHLQVRIFSLNSSLILANKLSQFRSLWSVNVNYLMKSEKNCEHWISKLSNLQKWFNIKIIQKWRHAHKLERFCIDPNLFSKEIVCHKTDKAPTSNGHHSEIKEHHFR